MKKIVVQLSLVLLLVLALPVSFFLFQQASNLTENEDIVQQAFNQQLETILFTINQNSENIIMSWVNQLDVPLYCIGETIDEMLTQLLMNNSAIQDIIFFDIQTQQHIKQHSRAQHLPINKPSEEIFKNLEHLLQQGYRKVETHNAEENTVLTFRLKAVKPQVLATITLNNQTFIEQNLSSGIQQIAQNRFSVSITDTLSQQMIYAVNASIDDQQAAYTQPMWYIPGTNISIALMSATITDLVYERAQRQNYLFAIMVFLLVLGVVFVIVTIRREVRLAEMKSEFVSNVSHEIRTPLALISMYSETLLLKRIKSEQKASEYLNVIHQETSRLTALVNRILSFSKMEKKKREYHFSDVDVNELIVEVCDNFEPHFKAQAVELNLKLNQQIPLISADRDSITESLINLIDNAVKYGNFENKKIEILTRSTDDNIYIDVEDNGIGISKKHQKLVFDKFYRVTEGNLAHKAKGSGLGLNIVKMIMEKHNGKIVLSSQQSKGCCFTLIFPLKKILNGQNTNC